MCLTIGPCTLCSRRLGLVLAARVDVVLARQPQRACAPTRRLAPAASARRQRGGDARQYFYLHLYDTIYGTK